MTDEITLRRQMDRAAKAQNIINDDLLKEAFAVIETDYIRLWKGSLPGDREAREQLFFAISVIDKVKQHLITVLNDGKMAQRDLDDFLTLQARKAGAQ